MGEAASRSEAVGGTIDQLIAASRNPAGLAVALLPQIPCAPLTPLIKGEAEETLTQ